MGYIKQSLVDGERIVYRTKVHPVIFVWPVLFFLIAGVAFKSGFDIIAQILFSLTLIMAFVVIAMYSRSEFAVTSRRVFGKEAIYRDSKYPEVQLVDLHEAKFKPGLLSGLFAYGTVVVTDREGKRHKFPGVPAEFYQHVQARNERARRALN